MLARLLSVFVLFIAFQASAQSGGHPAPLLKKGEPVTWWFVYKFNASSFPGCKGSARRTCPFGGNVQDYSAPFGQRFAYASDRDETLREGAGCVGDSVQDPVGATFDQLYNSTLNYVIWNDQPYGDPKIAGCTNKNDNCDKPWGHSKGVLAWDKTGSGFVIQVSTPSWPESGSKAHPRTDGNSLGCVTDNNVEAAQHFFALKLDKVGVLAVLRGLRNASVVTDPTNPQVVSVRKSPSDIRAAVNKLGYLERGRGIVREALSPDVELISKPYKLNVPPWQMVSSLIGGVSLRAATWWTYPKIKSTTHAAKPACWDASLKNIPGPVEIATTGHWAGEEIGLEGARGPKSNHAKLGVSLSGPTPYVIFGDLNQQGALAPGDAYAKQKCSSSQNGRGGLFFVIKNDKLHASLSALLNGKSAPE